MSKRNKYTIKKYKSKGGTEKKKAKTTKQARRTPKEKNEDFSSEFIRLARNVYFTNDLRFEIKNNINIFYKSGFVEEKQYVDYKAKK